LAVPEQQSGLFGKLLNAGKRVLTGEDLFMTAFINQNNSKEKFLCLPYPGQILPIDLTEFQGKLSARRVLSSVPKAYLLGLNFLKKLGRGFFGGEGFIIEGDGLAFLYTPGGTWQKSYEQGEVLK
jgi:uncharacterized protein (AIM24 family)